ncbi:hypothetical protein QBC46DRAFT_297192 [Diplogelasinospora grovesii]|uniref:mRNA 3'-end-processing protein n=1 Tax=Diplogelasinospora grovesii TaxID=303347 RepID=A0AAN6N0F5_9PEZI|nr:hypothetical protein QBC46DRAFT_297192 [Diplogelasinospora grovesii]
MATTTGTPPSSAIAGQLLSHNPPPQPTYTFSFTPFLQRTYQHSLPVDRPICKSYTTSSCPLKSRCPERHVGQPNGGKEGGFGSLVCKHWLRGLCKKGESCEFLHEYNLRKMPECNFFVRNGYCSNGDECLYLHIDPQSKLPPCPHYDNRGFCPLGPRCDKKHVRRANICPYYLCGFCPEGARVCKLGAHPKWIPEAQLEPPKAKPPPPSPEQMALQNQQNENERQQQWDEHGGGQQQQGGWGDNRDGSRDRHNRDGRDGYDRDGGGGGGHRGGYGKDRFGDRGGDRGGRGGGRGRWGKGGGRDGSGGGRFRSRGH